MIRDKRESLAGENSWTKLLDDKDSSNSSGIGNAVIVKMSNTESSNLIGDNLKETSPLNVIDHLTPNCDAGTDGNGVENGVNGGGVGVVGAQITRKESLLDTFHKHIRRSIKAVSESPGPITRYRQTRFSSRRVRKRVVFKHGECNVVQGNVAKRRRRYLQDIFTTLVDAQWRWTLLVFALSFLISWAAFAFVWWVIAYAHGDLEYKYLIDNQPELAANLTHKMCVTEVRSIMSAFLYSIETQHTIGYGNRYVTEECPEAIFTMCLQCITGVFIQAFMVGIVFAKLSRPKKRAQTLLFSRNAVICQRDGVPCLMFRVGDMRKSHIIEAHVRAQIIRKKITKEGEILPFYQQELKIGADGGEDRLMFIWPTTIVHKIDRHSPLYMLSASDMLKERFEVVCMLEGVIESTGMTTQARTSYLPSEILWGHRFVNVVSFRKETGEYEVDYTLFNNTYDVDTPLCSAKQLDDIRIECARNKSVLDIALAQCLDTRNPSTISIDQIDPASDESLYSERLQTRSNSIQNGILAAELQPLTQSTTPHISFTVGGASIPSSPMGTLTNLQSINEKSNSNSGNSSSNTLNISNNNYNNNNNNSNNNLTVNHNINNNNYNNNNNNNNDTINNNNNNSLSVSNSNINNNNNNNGNNSNNKQKSANTRRLSIRQDQLPIDSLC